MVQTSHTAPNSAWSVKSLTGWAIAIAGSVVLNITLFGLMQGLIQRVPAAPEKLDVLKHVQVVRVKKEPEPVQKKELKKTPPPKPVKIMKQTRQTRLIPKKSNLKPRLDFKLNPQLPAAPMDLVMPALEHFSLNGPVLKAMYDVAELDTGLMALVKIPPVYPVRAQKRGIEGFVSVEFLVTPTGLVQDITIIHAEPETVFNTAVKTCVSHWKFKPPTVEGIPVAAKARTTIHFKLE